MEAFGKSTIKFKSFVNNKWLPCHMVNVLYIPDARRNLFSVTSALGNGLNFNSTKIKCEFVKDGVVKAYGVRYG